MIFDRSVSYDLNPLSMPRLNNDECYNDIQDILVRQIDESTGVVRFTDILDYSKKSNLHISEVSDLLREYYDMDLVGIINETKMTMNEEYQMAVIEAMNYMPLQIDSIGIDEEFSELLEYCIIMDLENNNTEYTDQLFIETGIIGNLDGLSMISNAKDNVISGVKHYGSQALSKGAGLLKSMAGKVLNPIGNYLDTHDNVATRFINDKIDTGGQKLSNWATGHINNLVDKGQNALETKGKDFLKNAAQKVGIGAIIATAANTINNLTNQENMTSNNPSVLQRVLNSLKQMYERLMGQKDNATPQQQGVFSNLMNKLSNGMKSVEAKLKLVGGQK